MKRIISKTVLIMSLAVAGWIWNGDLMPRSSDLVATAEARIGRPATPLSYAGVARRTTVRVATPGVGVNRGGPVNRVGRW
jgi:hypothetical protein